MIRFGFQPSLFANWYAWIAKVGVAKIASVSAPDDFSFAICEETSGDGDLVGLCRDDLHLRPLQPAA